MPATQTDTNIDYIRPEWKIARGYFDYATGQLWDDETCDMYEQYRYTRERDTNYQEYQRLAASENKIPLMVFMGYLTQVPRHPDDTRVNKDLVREQVRLSRVVQTYVQLRRIGTDKYQGQCCFHEDRLPSLSIDDKKGLWYCHAGCGGGDVFSFLMKKNDMSFKQALDMAQTFM